MSAFEERRAALEAGHPDEHNKVARVFNAMGRFADEYDTVADALADTPAGGVLYIPSGEHAINDGLIVDKHVTLQGAGWRSPYSSVFGSADYKGTKGEYGSVLTTTMPSGSALDIATSGVRVVLRDIMIKGIADDTRTTSGINIGGIDAPPDLVQLENVRVANFKIGINAINTFYLLGLGVSVYGCETGLFLNGNSNQFHMLIAKGCTTGVTIYNGYQNHFSHLDLEGNSGTSLLLDGATRENVFGSIWFENSSGLKALELTSEANANIFHCIHCGTANDTLTIGGDGNRVTMNYSNVGITLTGNYNVIRSDVVDLTPTINGGVGNMFERMALLGSTNSYVYEFLGNGAGLAIENGALLLKDTSTGTWKKIEITNGSLAISNA